MAAEPARSPWRGRLAAVAALLLLGAGLWWLLRTDDSLNVPLGVEQAAIVTYGGPPLMVKPFKWGVGKLVANDSDSYRYLAESIRVHPGQEQLKSLLEQAGLERVEYFNLSAGVVALHRGYRF